MSVNILVLGAGELGNAMLSALYSQAPPSSKIFVLLRPSTLTSPPPSKVAEVTHLKSLNIALVPGNVASTTPSELSFASGQGSQSKIARAVLDAKVKHFIPWQFGVDYDIIGRGSAQDLFDEQVDVRDVLRSQDKTEWITVSTGTFTSFLFESYFGVVDLQDGNGKRVVRALGDWKNKVTLTTGKDIVRLTARLVFEEGRKWGEVVFVAGDTVSYGKVADMVDQLLRKKVRRDVWTVERLKKELKGDPEIGLFKYLVVFAEGKGCWWDKESTWNAGKEIQAEDLKG